MCMCGCDQWLHEQFNEQREQCGLGNSLKGQAPWQLAWSQKADRALVRQLEGFLSSAGESLATARQALAIPSEGRTIWVICPASHSDDFSTSTRQDFLNSIRTINKYYTSSLRRASSGGSMGSLWPVGVTPGLWALSMSSTLHTYTLKQGSLSQTCKCTRSKISTNPEKGWLVSGSTGHGVRYCTL